MSTPLFNKAQAAVAAFCSRDETRPVLCAVHITDTHVEATDSYRLVRITHSDGPTSLDFPKVDGKTAADGAMDVLVDGRAFCKALAAIPAKQSLPILNRMAVLEDGEHTVSFGVTDLQQSTVTIARKIEGAYPDFDKLLPTDEPEATVMFDPGFFKQMGAAFAQFGAGPVTVEFRQPLKPVVFRATNHSGQTMEAVLMPVRS